MRPLSLALLVLTPVLAISCAFGRNVRPTGRDGGDGGRGEGGGGGEWVPDPGSTDPGNGGFGAQDGEGDPQGGAAGAAGGGPAICAHDPCVVGAALDPGCDPCVADTCAFDAFCCMATWSEQCVAETTCQCNGGGGGVGGQGGFGGGQGGSAGFGGQGGFGGDPGGGGFGGGSTGGCDHDACTTGGPLDPSCNTCAENVCTIDSFCCMTAWDDECILKGLLFCSTCD